MKFEAIKPDRTTLLVWPKSRNEFNRLATHFLNRGYIIRVEGTEGLTETRKEK